MAGTNLHLEEFKAVAEERRFVVTRYMQAMAFYFAFVAFAGREYFRANGEEAIFLLLLMFTVNTVAWLGARQFKSMAIRAIDREQHLADELGMKRDLTR